MVIIPAAATASAVMPNSKLGVPSLTKMKGPAMLSATTPKAMISGGLALGGPATSSAA